MTKTENNIYDLLISEPLRVEIDISNPTILERLLKKKTKKYQIKPLVLSDYLKIAKLLDECEELIDIENENILLNSIKVIAKYKNEIVKMVSIFFNEKEKYVLRNFDVSILQKSIIKIIEYNNFSQFFFILNLAKQNIAMREVEN